MAWSIELSEGAQKALRKLDRGDAQRILRFLHERLSTAEHPRRLGQALKGSELGGLWRYRVGDHRLIAHLEDGRLVVLVVAVGHRREVYR